MHSSGPKNEPIDFSHPSMFKHSTQQLSRRQRSSCAANQIPIEPCNTTEHVWGHRGTTSTVMQLANVDAPLLFRGGAVRDYGISLKHDSGASASFHAEVETDHCREKFRPINRSFAVSVLLSGNCKSITLFAQGKGMPDNSSDAEAQGHCRR